MDTNEAAANALERIAWALESLAKTANPEFKTRERIEDELMGDSREQRDLLTKIVRSAKIRAEAEAAKRAMNHTLDQVIAKADALGPDAQSDLHMKCQQAGRHGVAASPDVLGQLPRLATGGNAAWRYCPSCWTIFDDGGQPIGSIRA